MRARHERLVSAYPVLAGVDGILLIHQQISVPIAQSRSRVPLGTDFIQLLEQT